MDHIPKEVPLAGRSQFWAATLAGATAATVAVSGAAPPQKDVPVSTIVLDYAADIAPRLNIQSDGLGTYVSAKNQLVSIIQGIGDWELDARTPSKATRKLTVDYVQPIPGSGPGGTDPTPPPAGTYPFRAIAKCSQYGNSMLNFTAGQVKNCPLRFGVDVAGKSYVYVMDPLNAPNGPFPQTNWATVKCIYPTTGSGACSQWRITPSGTYIDADNTVKYRNVAKLLEDATGAAIDHGDFYVSFSLVVAK